MSEAKPETIADNAAAMRGALKNTNYWLSRLFERGNDDSDKRMITIKLIECRDSGRDALSAPPRNCDVGTPAEQTTRFFDFCYGKSCGACRLVGKKGETSYCKFKWAQMPYKKGGAG